ncbi:MAG: hypothetical protein COA38_03235 [Fluviicola sp.]|nr:MAG: hypothetical protein COA38_03235 [Fluviicola sp.]
MMNLTSNFFRTACSLFFLTHLLSLSALGQINSDYLTQTMDSLFFHEDGDKRPGYSVAIVKDNTVIYQRSIGQINVEKEIEFNENSVFAIASCSKQFTAFGVLLLEQEGKLQLTDDIRTYIPELPKFSYTITIQHLLSHTSGIRDHLILLDWENKQWSKDYQFKGTIQALQKYKELSFQPGEDFAYSNTGYTLLAMLIERVSEIPFEKFMYDSIFEPLKMTNTHFSEKRDYRNIGYSRPYNYNWDKKKFITYRRKEVNALGAVGIYTTINDFIKWDENFSSMIVGNENLFEKFLRSDTLNNGMVINYNNGLKERDVRGYHVVEHSGGWAYYNFQYTRIPELNLSIIIASNNEFDYPIGMAEQYLKSILPNERMQTQKSSTEAKNVLHSGDYISDDFTLRKIEHSQKGVTLSGAHLYGAKKYQIYTDKDANLIDSTKNAIIPNSTLRSFRWSGGSYFNVPREYHAIDSLPMEIKNLEGKYINSELGSIRIRYKQKKGTIKIKTSFGKNPKIKRRIGQFIDLESVHYDLFIKDVNTLVIGNHHVFNLMFTRK